MAINDSKSPFGLDDLDDVIQNDMEGGRGVMHYSVYL